MDTADGTTIGNPQSGDYFLFYNSSNGDQLTRRDSAGNDTIYGTGEGIDALGWVALTDTTYTPGSPFSILSSTDTVLRFNADSILESYAPNGYTASDFFDDVGFRVNSPVLGAAYMFRVTFKCVPSNSSRVLNMTYSIGTGVGAQIPIDVRTFDLRTSGVASNISSSSLIYSLGTFLTNGLEIIVNPTTNCDIYDIGFVLSRIN